MGNRIQQVQAIKIARDRYELEKQRMLERLDEKRRLLDRLERAAVPDRRQHEVKFNAVNHQLNLAGLEHMADDLEERDDFERFVQEYKQKEKQLNLV